MRRLLYFYKMTEQKAIGIFDSGYGGLTVLKALQQQMPAYDYLYLGDNARAPYGDKSFDVIYNYTLEAVQWFFAQGCNLVILACNTASAKALRNIQQKYLPLADADKRVLGVIRPTAEVIGNYTKNGSVGIVGTKGTVQSASYILEIEKFYPQIKVSQQACPMWVPLIENGEADEPGTDYYVKKYLDQLFVKDEEIDCLLLGCTHYPLLLNKIKQYLPENIIVIEQGPLIAESLQKYLQNHPKMEETISKNGECSFYTTGAPEEFNHRAALFFGKKVSSKRANL